MADAAALYYNSDVLDYGNENTRKTKGVLILSDGERTVVLGALKAPDRGRECHTCKSTEHLAKDCPEKAKLIKCNNCFEQGHVREQCPRVLCVNCYEIGHVKRMCTNPAVCRTCHRPGHVAKDCGAAKLCSTCKKPGHKAKQCQEVLCTRCGETTHTFKDCCKRMVDAEPKQAVEVEKPEQAEKHKQAVEVDKPEQAKKQKQAAEAEKPEQAAHASSSKAELDRPKEGQEERGEGGGSGPPAPAIHRFPAPTEERMWVDMQNTPSSNHIAKVGFQITGRWHSQSATSKDGWDDKTVEIYFTGENLQEGQEFTTLATKEEQNPFPDSLNAFVQQQADLEAVVAQGVERATNDNPLVYLEIRVRTTNRPLPTSDMGKGKASTSGVEAEGFPPADEEPMKYGLGLFTDADFGPFSARFDSLRRLLDSPKVLTVGFLALTAAGDAFEFSNLVELMRQQREANPLLRWWKQGRPNPQTGQEMAKEDRPEGYLIHKRFTFASKLEYFTVVYHNLVHELEVQEARVALPTTVFLAALAGGEDNMYYAHLDIPPDAEVHFAEGTALRLKMCGIDTPEKEDWAFTVIEPMPFTPATQVAGFVYRPRLGRGGFLNQPELQQDVHYLFADEHTSSERMRQGMKELRGISCYVTENPPRVGLRRSINALNHLFRGQPFFGDELQLLLANDTRSLPVLDFFAPLRARIEATKLAKHFDDATKHLSPEQKKEIFCRLERMKGGVLCVQGPGGTGKTETIVVLCRLLYVLRCLYPELRISNLWLMSSANRQLDDLARKVYRALRDAYADLQAQGLNCSHPVVMRRHMGATEKGVYRRQAERKRALALRDTEPAHYDPDLAEGDESMRARRERQGAGQGAEEDAGEDSDEDSDEDSEAEESEQEAERRALVESLATKVRLQRAIEQLEARGRDKRLRVEDLSEGRWILRAAGFPDPGSSDPHPIATPERYGKFRALMEQLERGDDMSPSGEADITIEANLITADLASRADAIAMTPDVVSQHRAHSLQQPFAVLHDEAGKTHEIGSVGALIYSRPYTVKGGLQVTGDRVPHILFGDVHQPPPVKGQGDKHPFSQQSTVSLFERLVSSGQQTAWLYEQRRSNEDINSLINHLLPKGRMRVSQEVERRPESLAAKVCAKDVFDSDKRVVFMRLSGKEEVLPSTHSRYNRDFVPKSIEAAARILLHGRTSGNGFRGEQGAIVTPYTAQVRTLHHAMRAYTDWLLRSNDDVAMWLARELLQVEIMTADSLQGNQKEFVVHDTVCTESLGFTAYDARQLLANGRARSLLVIVGAPDSLYRNANNPNRFATTAYYKSWDWCYHRNCVVHLWQPDSEHTKKWSTQSRGYRDMEEVLTEFHADTQRQVRPCSFGHGGVPVDENQGDGSDKGSGEGKDEDGGEGNAEDGGWPEVGGWPNTQVPPVDDAW